MSEMLRFKKVTLAEPEEGCFKESLKQHINLFIQQDLSETETINLIGALMCATIYRFCTNQEEFEALAEKFSYIIASNLENIRRGYKEGKIE